MDKKIIYITKEKKKELEAELLELSGPKRKEIIDALEYAKSLGDLSENAEYHQAREDQGKLEERIKKVEQILKSSVVVKKSGSDTVEIGSDVVVEKEGTKEQKNYIIVGSEEADMLKGKISNNSPIGQALFGKKKGDTVSFRTPKGLVNYKIIKVS
jgi:transcription elongation factor GreA